MTRAQADRDMDEARELIWLAGARMRARQAAAQLAPFAAAAAGNARQGMYQARTWTAPRLEQTGLLLQEQVAPRMAAMLASAAHRLDPAPPVPPKRRRWPLVTIGLIAAAGLGVAAFLKNRREPELAEAPDATTPPAEPADATGSDVDGRVQTT